MENNNATAKVISILDYIGFLWILGLFVEKDDPHVKFHTNQGLVLFLLDVVVGIVNVVFSFLSFIPVVGLLLSIVVWVLYVGCFVLMILGIVNAAQGQQKPLPLIGGITLLK